MKIKRTSMASSTRSKTDVYLLESIKKALSSTKLPSISVVLDVYLHRLKTSGTKHEAATCTHRGSAERLIQGQNTDSSLGSCSRTVRRTGAAVGE